MPEDNASRPASPDTGEPLNQEAMENLRTFFVILQEWEEEDRQESECLASARRGRATKTIAEHYTKVVELESGREGGRR